MLFPFSIILFACAITRKILSFLNFMKSCGFSGCQHTQSTIWMTEYSVYRVRILSSTTVICELTLLVNHWQTENFEFTQWRVDIYFVKIFEDVARNQISTIQPEKCIFIISFFTKVGFL